MSLHGRVRVTMSQGLRPTEKEKEKEHSRPCGICGHDGSSWDSLRREIQWWAALGRAGKQEVAMRHQEEDPKPTLRPRGGRWTEQKLPLARTEQAAFSEPRQAPVREAMIEKLSGGQVLLTLLQGAESKDFGLGRVGPGAKGMDV